MPEGDLLNSLDFTDPITQSRSTENKRELTKKGNAFTKADSQGAEPKRLNSNPGGNPLNQKEKDSSQKWRGQGAQVGPTNSH